MTTSLKLQEKVCVITGSTRGFGLAIARAFIREGATAIIASRTQQSVDSALLELRESGGQAFGFGCDVSQPDQVQELLSQTLESCGRLDIWVNNAALSAAYGPTVHVSPDEFVKVTQTNVLGTYYGSLAAMRYFLGERRGKLINVTGRGDREPQPMQNAYASSKAWVINFTLALAKEYKDSGVGIYVQNPGLMETDLLQNIEAVAGYEERLKNFPTVRRMWSQPPEIPAEKTVWLASDATDGRTSLVIKEMTFPKILGGALRELGNRILRRPVKPVETHITTIPPAYPLPREAE